MRMTLLIPSLNNIEHGVAKTLENLVYACDSKQWVQAGVAAGQMRELGERLRSLSFIVEETIRDEQMGEN